jgi:hypothetical protein
MILPMVISQSRAVLSALAEAKNLQSGEIVTPP